MKVVVTVEFGRLAGGRGLMAAAVAVAVREEILRADRAMTQITHMVELFCPADSRRGGEV